MTAGPAVSNAVQAQSGNSGSQKTPPEETVKVIEETDSEEARQASIPYRSEDSKAMISIMDYMKDVTDPASSAYVEKEDRIAVFDYGGTLYGGLYPYSGT